MEVSDVTMLSTGKYVRQETLSVSKLLLTNLNCVFMYVIVYSGCPQETSLVRKLCPLVNYYW